MEVAILQPMDDLGSLAKAEPHSILKNSRQRLSPTPSSWADGKVTIEVVKDASQQPSLSHSHSSAVDPLPAQFAVSAAFEAVMWKHSTVWKNAASSWGLCPRVSGSGAVGTSVKIEAPATAEAAVEATVAVPVELFAEACDLAGAAKALAGGGHLRSLVRCLCFHFAPHDVLPVLLG